MTDDIAYTILGDDMQIVEISIEPGARAIAEAGAINYMDEGISYEAVLGDGSQPSRDFWDIAMNAGKRVITGNSIFLTHFRNDTQMKRTVAFAAPYPGKIIPLDLGMLGGGFTCQKSSILLCAAKGTQLDVTFTKNIGFGLFGGEDLFYKLLKGSGRHFSTRGAWLSARS